jgi:hypothetical protein
MSSAMHSPSPAESGVSSEADKEIEAHDEALQEKSEGVLEDESNYATGLRLGLIVMGLTLSVLLVALVSLHPDLYWPSLKEASGPSHSSHRNPNHHYCFQFYPRRGLVWKCIPHNDLRLAAHIGETLSAFLLEMDLSKFSRII